MTDESYEKAASWLIENDVVNDPLVLNGIIVNTMMLVSGVADLECVLDQNNKRILLWAKIDYGKKPFFKKKVNFEESIRVQVSDIITGVLPRWKNRVTFERRLFDKALNIVNGIS